MLDDLNSSHFRKKKIPIIEMGIKATVYQGCSGAAAFRYSIFLAAIFFPPI